MKTITKNYLRELTYEIIGAAIEVHREMGPGLLEKVYEVCMKGKKLLSTTCFGSYQMSEISLCRTCL